jgi:GTP-binding protein LepA
VCSVGTSGEERNKMRQFGKVDIPQEAFIAALKVDS